MTMGWRSYCLEVPPDLLQHQLVYKLFAAAILLEPHLAQHNTIAQRRRHAMSELNIMYERRQVTTQS